MATRSKSPDVPRLGKTRSPTSRPCDGVTQKGLILPASDLVSARRERAIDPSPDPVLIASSERSGAMDRDVLRLRYICMARGFGRAVCLALFSVFLATCGDGSGRGGSADIDISALKTEVDGPQ